MSLRLVAISASQKGLLEFFSGLSRDGSGFLSRVGSDQDDRTGPDPTRGIRKLADPTQPGPQPLDLLTRPDWIHVSLKSKTPPMRPAGEVISREKL